jgi:hypothetical protein
VIDRLLRAELRFALFCACLGVVLGAATLGPFDLLLMLPAAVAACAVVLAVALARGRLGRDVVRRPDAEDESADDDGQDVAERLGSAGGHGEG